MITQAPPEWHHKCPQRMRLKPLMSSFVIVLIVLLDEREIHISGHLGDLFQLLGKGADAFQIRSWRKRDAAVRLFDYHWNPTRNKATTDVVSCNRAEKPRL